MMSKIVPSLVAALNAVYLTEGGAPSDHPDVQEIAGRLAEIGPALGRLLKPQFIAALSNEWHDELGDACAATVEASAPFFGAAARLIVHFAQPRKP